MTLQASGVIQISDINVELGRAYNTWAGLGDSALRTLAGVPSGSISLASFYGKSNFQASWSGNSVAGGSVYQFQTSGNAIRAYSTLTSTGGTWIYTYTNGTFSGGESTAAGNFQYVSGFGTSGNLLRSRVYTTYGNWISLSTSTIWGYQVSDAAQSPARTRHEGSGSSFRIIISDTVGNWVTLV